MNVVCKTEEIDFVITDDKTDKNSVKELRKRGVNVVIA
jgi:DeoR/GlpR family transcriptional regulator of sugar metabolism